jgi:hypothetical protein
MIEFNINNVTGSVFNPKKNLPAKITIPRSQDPLNATKHLNNIFYLEIVAQ